MFRWLLAVFFVAAGLNHFRAPGVYVAMIPPWLPRPYLLNAVSGACTKLYDTLTAKGVDVLYDDTDQRAGAKFAAADLIGVPWQITVGPKGLAEGKVEIKRRSDGTRENISPADVLARF